MLIDVHVTSWLFSRICVCPCTSLCGNDGDIMPLLMLAVQLCRRSDESRVRSDAEQSLRVGLRIDGEPEGDMRRFILNPVAGNK